MRIKAILDHHRSKFPQDWHPSLDIFAILYSGREFADEIADELRPFTEGEVRRLDLFPSQSHSDKQPMYLADSIREGRIPAETSSEEFAAQRDLRVMGVPNPENIAVLADNYIYDGITMTVCLRDIFAFGYQFVYYCIESAFDPFRAGIYYVDTLERVNRNTSRRSDERIS